MTAQARYTVDRVGDNEWQVFDQAKKGTPVTYLLFVTEVSGGSLLNMQLTITSYDASAPREMHVFEEELYSTLFYASTDEQCELLIFDVIDKLMDSEIENPVELAYMFGGTIRNRPIIVPQMLSTN
jgi:hypothetical protein